MKVKANAKINLYLDVISKRSDGYHNIETIMQEISLADEIEVLVNKTGEINLTVSGKFLVSPGKENIVYKACELVRDKFGIKAGVDIHLIKNIPFGAGLGGGSSDAAAVVKALASLWEIDIYKLELATSLGADVPFFLNGGRAFAEGIGEKLTYTKNYPKQYLVLVYPHLNISTKEAYQNLSLKLTKPSKKCSITHLFNKFEESVFKAAPEVKKIKDELIALGAEAALMSGSGSSVFGIVASHSLAESIKNQILDKHKEYSAWSLNTL